MLKKLVKYGNSNALVLDKPILDLLNIQEGAILKIKTDGKSIILTPHQEVESLEVVPTLSAQDMFIKSSILEGMSRFSNLGETQKYALAQKRFDLHKKMQYAMEKVMKNPGYQKDIQDAAAQGLTVNLETWAVRHEELFDQYAPELIQIKKDLANFEVDHNLTSVEVGQKEQDINNISMRQKFAAIFKKFNSEQMAQKLQSPEYLHEAQLIAEKYQNNTQSAECVAEMKELMYKYCPEMRQVHEEVAQVAGQKK